MPPHDEGLEIAIPEHIIQEAHEAAGQIEDEAWHRNLAQSIRDNSAMLSELSRNMASNHQDLLSRITTPIVAEIPSPPATESIDSLEHSEEEAAEEAAEPIEIELPEGKTEEEMPKEMDIPGGSRHRLIWKRKVHHR